MFYYTFFILNLKIQVILDTIIKINKTIFIIFLKFLNLNFYFKNEFSKKFHNINIKIKEIIYFYYKKVFSARFKKQKIIICNFKLNYNSINL